MIKVSEITRDAEGNIARVVTEDLPSRAPSVKPSAESFDHVIDAGGNVTFVRPAPPLAKRRTPRVYTSNEVRPHSSKTRSYLPESAR